MLLRNSTIDFLRFIGLSMIILAHVEPPAILFQLRNFDVPLMVIISGMSFGLAFKNEPYFSYFWKRVKRLVFPVWIFLTIYFIALYFFRPLSGDLSIHTILGSYFLLGGIGYVWIIRVFLLIAIVAPFIYSLNRLIKSDNIYLGILLIVFLMYEFCRYLSFSYFSFWFNETMSLVLFYLIPYSVLFALGLRMIKFGSMTNNRLFLFFFIVFGVMAIYFWENTGSFVQTQKYKYPPSTYYFSYAILVSMFLWIIGGDVWRAVENSRLISKIILFIAQNSIWIYLWHIPFIKVIHLNFLAKYIVVYSCAVGITFIQVWLVNNVLIKLISKQSLNKNIKMILTG